MAWSGKSRFAFLDRSNSKFKCSYIKKELFKFSELFFFSIPTLLPSLILYSTQMRFGRCDLIIEST